MGFFFSFKILEMQATTVLSFLCLPGKTTVSVIRNEISQIWYGKGIWKVGGGDELLTCLLARGEGTQKACFSLTYKEDRLLAHRRWWTLWAMIPTSEKWEVFQGSSGNYSHYVNPHSQFYFWKIKYHSSRHVLEKWQSGGCVSWHSLSYFWISR